MVELELGWILGIVATMGVTISTLAGIIYKLLLNRIRIQDGIISKLQEDVARLSQGCGLNGCHFKR